MNTKELGTFLKEHLVPAKLYSLNGAHNNRICLEHSNDGWNVFFADRKDRVGLSHYNSETEACLGMKNEIRKFMETAYGLTFVRQ
ncbi:MAG: hypothetical protein SPL99_10870 [Catonella sp.]|jgi:hypothetical protein|nr:hypothetical protein [Catonella sp.]MDY6356940.1 hypothetical protein [Catonella sp.]